MNRTTDLEAELEHARQSGGYEVFVIKDEDGHRFELVDVGWPRNGQPLVLLIRPAAD